MDQLLPRYDANTDAFADRAALVLKGSERLTCVRSGHPLALPPARAEYSPHTIPQAAHCALQQLLGQFLLAQPQNLNFSHIFYLVA